MSKENPFQYKILHTLVVPSALVLFEIDELSSWTLKVLQGL